MAINNFLGDGNGYIGNPDLKPEVAHTFSVTGDWHSTDGTTYLKAAPYYSRVNNYIDAVCSIGQHPMYPPTPNVTKCGTDLFIPLQYANQAARLYGIDLSGRTLLARTAAGEFGVKGLLNYVKGKNLDTSEGLYNIMPLNVKLTLTHEYAGWSNAVEVIGVKNKSDVSAVRNEIKTPGYSLVHLRGSYAWKQARLDFGIENLFDKSYSLPTGGAYVGQGNTMSMSKQHNSAPWGIAVPGAGRSFYVGLTLKL
jgi:iron complex outermembrane receptor protein